MNLTDFANRLLWEACPASGSEENGKDIRVFYMETHCMGYWVKAELLSTAAPYGAWNVVDMVASDGESYPF